MTPAGNVHGLAVLIGLALASTQAHAFGNYSPADYAKDRMTVLTEKLQFSQEQAPKVSAVIEEFCKKRQELANRKLRVF